MKVYFAAALSGKVKYEKNYNIIYNTLEKMGFKNTSDHVVKTTFEQVKNASDKELTRYYEKTLKNIRTADVVVAEVSHPTVGVGHEISIAIEKGKPVLVLLVEGSLVPQILKAVPTGTVKIARYNIENIEETLLNSLDSLKAAVPIRFNFFISPEINQYLDWISKVKRTPRAVYLRELLEKEMEKSKEFKGSKS